MWSEWQRAVDLKSWGKLSSPWSRGGEILPEDPAGDNRLAPNAVKIVAHDIAEVTMRIGSDGYPRWWTDEWGRVGSFLVETSYIKW